MLVITVVFISSLTQSTIAKVFQVELLIFYIVCKDTQLSSATLIISKV